MYFLLVSFFIGVLFLTQQQKIQGSAFLQNNNPTLGAWGLSFHIPRVTMLWGRLVFTPLYGQGAQAWTVEGLAQDHAGTHGHSQLALESEFRTRACVRVRL